ncbi:MAG: GGDEF domain-containing protein [Athalassotoga sp.]|uniref:GGDEF domain-containing protein n=1 Tax=Athalassotoga sp. TaxID=2022597 RepID=UPI003D00027B
MIDMISVMNLSKEVKNMPGDIKGLIEISPSGSPVSSIGDFNGTINYTNSDIYHFVFLNGYYISTLQRSTGVPLITIATRSVNGNVVAINFEPKSVKSFDKSQIFLVDPTGFGVKISGISYVWRNFTSLMNLPSGSVINGHDIFIIKHMDQNYSMILSVPFWYVVYRTFVKLLTLYIIIFVGILVLAYLAFFEYSRNQKPMMDFTKFFENTDTFKKYNTKSNSKTIENYNKLVDQYEKILKDYAQSIEELNMANSNLMKLNQLYIEFPMTFDRISSDEDLENAIKIVTRKLFDLSNNVKGAGIKYKRINVTMGTISSYDLEESNESKFRLDLKTEDSSILFVMDLDKFTTTELFKEMLGPLLSHIATVISTYELRTKSKESVKYDPLTGLLTRQEFIFQSKKALEMARRDRELLAFFLIDIKNFKEFNETNGHLSGDVLLKFIAKVIASNSRITDLTCRWGEDSFAFCFSNIGKASLEDKQKEIISKIIEFKKEIKINTSCTFYPQDGDSFETLFSIAEKKLNNQK